MASRVGATFFLAAVLKTKLAAAGVCCCQEHDTEGNDNGLCFKGNSEDKQKKRFMQGDKTYCCKERGSNCDRYKYTLTSDSLNVKPTTIDWMDQFGISSTENAVLLGETCEIHVITTTTLTTTTTTVTTATTADPHRFVDITAVFGEEKVVTIKDVEYRCCCGLNEDGTGVTCGVKEDKPAGILQQLGCGSLFGSGYHSFLKIGERFPEFAGKEHAGQCWAKLSDLPGPVAEAAPKSLVVV